MDKAIEQINALAKSKNIITYKEFITSDNEFKNVYIPINRLLDVCKKYYLTHLLNCNIENENKILSARLYHKGFKYIDAKPFKPKAPKSFKNTKLDINKTLNTYSKSIKRCVLLTCFLNKNASENDLIEYIDFVCEALYDTPTHTIPREQLATIHAKAIKMSIREIDLQTKKFKFVNNFDKASLKVKMKIVNQGLYWDKSDQIHEKIRKAIYCLLETNEFIHSAIIAEQSGVPINEVKKYRSVFSDLINPHNKSKFGTKLYGEYANSITKDLINSAIAQLESKNHKVNITSIADLTGLHRNTISRNINN